MNIFIHELKQDRRSYLFWCLTVVLLIATSVAKTSGMVGDGAQSLNAMLVLMPKALQNMFGLGVVDLATPIGLMSVILLYVALILSFHAAMLGSSAFAKEERDRTFEFLYVRGRARTGILLAKLLAGAAQLVVINLLTFVASYAAIRFEFGTAGALLPMAAAMLVLQAVFYAVGLMASLLTRRVKQAGGAAMAVVMGLFLLAMLVDLAPGVAVLHVLTPFKAFDFKRMVDGGLSLAHAAAWLLIAASLTIVSFVLHRRRDLHT